jgi:hypothetical protein
MPLGGRGVAVKLKSAAPPISAAELDRALLAKLPPSFASSITERTEPIYGTSGYDERLTGYELTRPIPADEAVEALAILVEANKPADEVFILQELARMRRLTKARPQDADDLTLMAAAYAEEMAAYPADVIASACRKWAAMEKWWPSWAELKDLLEFRMRRRKAMLEALQRQLGVGW